MKKLFMGAFLLLTSSIMLHFEQNSNPPWPTARLELPSNLEKITLLHFISSQKELKFEKLAAETWIMEKDHSGQFIEANRDQIENFLRLFQQSLDLTLVKLTIKDDNNLEPYGLGFDKSTILIYQANNITYHLILGSYTSLGDEIFLLYNDTIYRASLPFIYQFFNNM